MIDIVAAREARRQRAREAALSYEYTVEKVDRFSWRVVHAGKEYIVTNWAGEWSCTCPDFQSRGTAIGTCKHIELVKLTVRGGSVPKGQQPLFPSPPETKPLRSPEEIFAELF